MTSLLANCFRRDKQHGVDYEHYSALDMGLSEEHGQAVALTVEGQTVTLTLTDRGLLVLPNNRGEHVISAARG